MAAGGATVNVQIRRIVDVLAARQIARAIRATRDRHRDGFMAHATMKSHVESLLGTARAAGLLDAVNTLLGE